MQAAVPEHEQVRCSHSLTRVSRRATTIETRWLPAAFLHWQALRDRRWVGPRCRRAGALRGFGRMGRIAKHRGAARRARQNPPAA
jgi:hypothetical protein